MSIKRGILLWISGIAVEAAALYGVHRFIHVNFSKYIDVHNVSDWLLCGVGFLSACWLFVWTKILAKIFVPKKKTETNKAPSQSSYPGHGGPVRPVGMAVQNNAVLNVVPQASAVVETPAASSVAPVVVPPASVKQPSQRDQDTAVLSRIDLNLDMMAFEHVVLQDKLVDLVYSSDDVAVLCKIISEEHTWSVDINSSIENSLWTDETGATHNICFDLLVAAAHLETEDSEARIMPAVVLMRGSVNNTEAVANYLAQNQIQLLWYLPDNPDAAHSLQALLKDNFSIVADVNEEDEQEPIEQPQE